jgi:hypothetical protein
MGLDEAEAASIPRTIRPRWPEGFMYCYPQGHSTALALDIIGGHCKWRQRLKARAALIARRGLGEQGNSRAACSGTWEPRLYESE